MLGAYVSVLPLVGHMHASAQRIDDDGRARTRVRCRAAKATGRGGGVARSRASALAEWLGTRMRGGIARGIQRSPRFHLEVVRFKSRGGISGGISDARLNLGRDLGCEAESRAGSRVRGGMSGGISDARRNLGRDLGCEAESCTGSRVCGGISVGISEVRWHRTRNLVPSLNMRGGVSALRDCPSPYDASRGTKRLGRREGGKPGWGGLGTRSSGPLRESARASRGVSTIRPAPRRASERPPARPRQDGAAVMRTFASTYLLRHTAVLFFAILICAIAEDGRSDPTLRGGSECAAPV